MNEEFQMKCGGRNIYMYYFSPCNSRYSTCTHLRVLLIRNLLEEAFPETCPVANDIIQTHVTGYSKFL